MSVVREGGLVREVARPFRERLPGDIEGLAAAGWLRDEPRAVALTGDWLGGATVLSSHPLAKADPADDPFSVLDRLPVQGESEPVDRRPVVGGGWFGWLGFGLAGAVEPVPPSPPRPMSLPPFDLAFHDHVVLRDAAGDWWFEALWSEARAELLSQRLACWRTRLSEPAPAARRFAAGPLGTVGAGLAGHRAIVGETVERIAAGELSQANLCLRLEGSFEGHPLDLWRTAAAAGAPAYAAYVASGERGQAVVSLSPELFLRRTGRRVLTRPIKGTAPVDTDPEQLGRSEKDRAENVMIVDLMRNDLGRVCRYGSVVAEELWSVRPAPGVWQLESAVAGELRSDVTDSQLLRATFPPGSVTGAPKVQALRTIAELESTAREAYCGAVGVCSPLSGLELNVAIRTLEVARRRVWLGVGGGIVSDSSPQAEVDEALTKARGVTSAAGLRLSTERSVKPRTHMRFDHLERPDPAAGLLETIRVSGGRAAFLEEHLARLLGSCAELGLPVPEQLAEHVRAEAAALGDGGLRITVGPKGAEVVRRSLPAAGVTELIPVALPGGLGAHKWADRRLIEAHSGPGRTPLLCDGDGTVLEAGYAAVLVASGERILAPRLDGRPLPSLSRERALQAARDAGWKITLRDVSLAELGCADAIILTSSLRDPHSGRLAGRPLSPRSAEICQALTHVLPLDDPSA